MIELRMLTPEAAKTRFDFIWQVENCSAPFLVVLDGERILRQALTSGLDDHGVLSRSKC